MDPEGEGSRAVPDQPFYLHLLSVIARVLDDPDWRVLTESRENYASGVRVGFRERLPRTPAVYEGKVRWRKYDPVEFALELKANYKSTTGHEATIAEQYAEEERLGMMTSMPLAEARRIYGDKLRIAPTAAIEKSDGAIRTLHDGTNGPAVNPNLRVRDQGRCPGNSDLKHAIAVLHDLPGQSFAIKLDVSKAHRQFLHNQSDSGALGV